MTVHIAKNFLDLPKLKVPLILGIWGGKGQGKTFQCTLAYKKLGIGPVVMSAGELESGNAGEPAKLIRQRYRSALIADCLAGSAVLVCVYYSQPSFVFWVVPAPLLAAEHNSSTEQPGPVTGIWSVLIYGLAQ